MMALTEVNCSLSHSVCVCVRVCVCVCVCVVHVYISIQALTAYMFVSFIQCVTVLVDTLGC